MRKFLIAIILALTSMPLFGQVKIYADPALQLSTDFGFVTAYKPPKIYEKWAKDIAECEKLKPLPKEKLDSLRYQMVNAPWFSFDSTFQQHYLAATSNPDNAVLITLPHIWDYAIVAHEFLHLTLEYNFGDKYAPKVSNPTKDVHPKQYFTRCDIAPY